MPWLRTQIAVLLLFTVFNLKSLQDSVEDAILIEGDIMVPLSEDPTDRGQIDRNGKRWPGGVIYYTLNETAYSLWDVFVIENAMDEFEEVSCVKFKKREHELDYIDIQPEKGCWSYFGRKGLSQTLSLDIPRCMNKGTVMHELMHALGFWHEHSRVDRDKFIEVHWENVVDDDKRSNFVKHSISEQDFLNLPYDYLSIMHYNAWAFSKSPKLPTLTPKIRGVRLRDLGRAKTAGSFTKTDIHKINKLYECSKERENNKK